MLGETRLWPPSSVSNLRGSATVAWQPVGPTEQHRHGRTCGSTALGAAVICSTCTHAIDQTRAYVPSPLHPSELTTISTPLPTDLDPRASVDEAWRTMIERMAAVELASRSSAELGWDSLETDEPTQVWNPDDATGAGVPGMSIDHALEPTKVDIVVDHDTARHRAVPLRLTEPRCAVAEAPAFTTSRMPPSRAALLLRLAPNGYAGSGTPIDAAVVARGQILEVGRACAGPWAGDPYLDDHHVRLLTDVDGIRIIDPGSRGGVWLRFAGSRWLRDGDWFRIGEQFLCYDAAGPDDPCRGRIQLIDHELRFGA